LSSKSAIMIFEGSCDTKDWSNDVKIQLSHAGINKTFKYNRKKLL